MHFRLTNVFFLIDLIFNFYFKQFLGGFSYS